MSLHKKDWLNLAALLGLGATGLGFAGIGPLGGLLGTSAGAVGAAGAGAAAGSAGAGAAGLLSPTATQTALLGLGGPEASGAIAGMGGGTASLFGPAPGLAADLTTPAGEMAGASLGSSLDGISPSALASLQGAAKSGKAAQYLNLAGKANGLLNPTPEPAPAGGRLGFGGTKQLPSTPMYGANSGPYGAGSGPYGGGGTPPSMAPGGGSMGGGMDISALQSLPPDQLRKLLAQMQGGSYG